MNKTVSILMAVLTISLSSEAMAHDIVSKHVSASVINKILSQGVPDSEDEARDAVKRRSLTASLKRILNAMDGGLGSSTRQTAYYCKDFGPMTTNACSKNDRIREQRVLDLDFHRYAVSIDFSLPSTEKRMYFIDLETGNVERFLVTHGKGSSPELSDGKPDESGKQGLYATQFSNVDNSKMTSLGLYLIGGDYRGAHGHTLRMYGLESTNDNAYIRDIVFHGADYAKESFIDSINRELNPRASFGRLGVSWGCPAVDPRIMGRILPLLKWGGIVDHYHPSKVR